MPQKNIPNFHLPEDLVEQYVNFVRISHTASEFVFDFSLLLPGVEKPSVDSRLIMSPTAVKLFLRAMAENLNRYETKFGEVKLPQAHTLADHLFKPNPDADPGKSNE
jgi:hypothetical protein